MENRRRAIENRYNYTFTIPILYLLKRLKTDNGVSLKKLIVIAFLMALLGLTPAKTSAAEYDTTQWQKEYLAQQAEAQWSSELVSYSRTLVGKRTGQCVVALRTYFGLSRNEVQGLARNTKINSKAPKIGAVIVLKMSRAGHVGLVIQEDEDNIIYFDSNGDMRQKGAIRKINKKDPRIKGYQIR